MVTVAVVVAAVTVDVGTVAVDWLLMLLSSLLLLWMLLLLLIGAVAFDYC